MVTKSAEFRLTLNEFHSCTANFTIVGHGVGVFSCLVNVLHFVPDLLCIMDKHLQFHNKRRAVNTYSPTGLVSSLIIY